MASLSTTGAAISRPAYFEFLLKPSMLEEHLSQADPDPSAIDLMTQMVCNSLKRTASEQCIGNHGDVMLMQRKGHMLVVLPLRILTHLNYDVQLLLDKLPLEMCDPLLNYLLLECLGPLAAELTPASFSLDLATLLPHQVHAASVYFRYVLAAVVASRVPRPPQHRNTPLNLPGMSGEGTSEYREEREVLLAELSSKGDFAARILDSLVVGATQVMAPVSTSFSLSVPNLGAAKGSTHNFNNCIEIPLQQFKCQVHYDLGLFYFVTERYSDANHHFTQAKELFAGLPEKTDHCSVCPSKLRAYNNSCSAICGRSTPLLQRTLLDRFTHATTAVNYQGLLDVLSQDDLTHELPLYLRQKLQVDLMAAPPHTTTQGLFFQVCCHNVMRCVLEEKVWDPRFPGHLVTAGKQGALFLLQLLSSKVGQLSSKQRPLVHQFLMCINVQEGVSAVLVPSLMATAPLANLFSHLEMLDMWQGVEEENQAKLMRQAMDVNYGVELLDDANLIWELIHSHEPVALRRAVTRYVASKQQQQHGQSGNNHKDILDLHDKWEIPSPIRLTLTRIPSTLHRYLVSIFVAKAQLLLQSKSWVESCDLLDAALKACGEVADGERGEGGRLYKMLTFLKLSHNIHKWIHSLPHTDDGNSLASEAKLCLMTLNGREDVVPWISIMNWCVMCLVNARDWGSLVTILSGLQMPSSSVPLMSFLRPLLETAHILDSSPSPSTHPHLDDESFPRFWKTMVKIMDTASQHRKGQNSKPIERYSETMGMTEFLELVYILKEPTCLTLLTSCLGALYNKLLGEPSAEVHILYPHLWSSMTPSKESDIATVREALSAVVQHAIKYFPGADHVSESVATSWHMTAADLSYTSEDHHSAVCHYLTAVFVATNYLRSDPAEDSTAHLVGDYAIRKMVRCCMNIGCYTQAGLLCQFLEPLDYSTALRCLQDRSGVDGMDAYYHCLWDVTLIEFILNTHHKRGEIQRRDAVLKVMGQLEINSNNNEEIQREAAKVRKHRLLRALAKQYLS
uniref:Integrator complex subunit 8-like n=2 Tax=Hirondellea gigas TaxID=1518452 RepID=A0A6A7G013_9CRUS